MRPEMMGHPAPVALRAVVLTDVPVEDGLAPPNVGPAQGSRKVLGVNFNILQLLGQDADIFTKYPLKPWGEM